jgi:ABC-type Fe3+-siderophore transport system permease subunit
LSRSPARADARPAWGWGARSANRKLALIAVLLGIAVVISLLLGRYPSPGIITPDRLASDDLAQRLVFNLRLPRILTALALGMSLSAAGAVLQQVFANPLVDPGFLGVSQDAAFGASLAIVFWGSTGWIVQGSAAVFAFAGLGLSYFSLGARGSAAPCFASSSPESPCPPSSRPESVRSSTWPTR